MPPLIGQPLAAPESVGQAVPDKDSETVRHSLTYALLMK